MKILFCSHCPTTKTFGAAKMLLELAEELQKLGCECTVLSPEEALTAASSPRIGYSSALREYLINHAAEYDVVDYDHSSLPYSRQEFAPNTLFVARSALLSHHFLSILIPRRRLLKSKLRQWFLGRWLDRRREVRWVRAAEQTMSQADVVFVLNNDDRDALLHASLSAEKIIVLPHGLTAAQMQALHPVSDTPPAVPRVITVATFDARKGAVELPSLLEKIWRAVPQVHFRLLGGRRPVEVVLSMFPKEMRAAVEVVPEYGQADLPSLLATGSVGIFPSYIEGFPLGVLEMLAAALPVIAYRAPGAPMMLPEAWLVRRGDSSAIAESVAELLQNRETLTAARRQARLRAADFPVEDVACQTMRVYDLQLSRLRSSV